MANIFHTDLHTIRTMKQIHNHYMRLHYNFSLCTHIERFCVIKGDSGGSFEFLKTWISQLLITGKLQLTDVILPSHCLWQRVGNSSLCYSLFQQCSFFFICFFQAFREEIAPINLKVKAVNDLSSQLSPLDLHPSLKMSRQLDDLNMRWKLLQVSAYPFHDEACNLGSL